MARRWVMAILGIKLAAIVGLVIYWRYFPRAGLRWTNASFNPWLVEHGLAGSGRSEIGTIEHVGRRTGARHLTPVHPVATHDGFRIVVPLADRSEWAKNVLAAGPCRLQLRDVVYELDEPVMVRPADVRDLEAPVRWMEERLGFTYLRLHRVAESPGTLEARPVSAATDVLAATEVIPAPDVLAASPTLEPVG